jgi:hypothetical protein
MEDLAYRGDKGIPRHPDHFKIFRAVFEQIDLILRGLRGRITLDLKKIIFYTSMIFSILRLF